MLTLLALLATPPAHAADCAPVDCALGHLLPTCLPGATNCDLTYNASLPACAFWDHDRGSITVTDGEVSLLVLDDTVFSDITVSDGATLVLLANGNTVQVLPSVDSEDPGVLVSGGAQVTLSGVDLSRRDTASLGDGVFGPAAHVRDSNSALCMTGGSVTNAQAESGAIYGEQNTNIDLTGVTFSNNILFPEDASSPQGADIWSDGQLALANTMHSGTTAAHDNDSHGGSVYFSGTSLTITDSTFTGYEATFGGAIAALNADSVVLNRVSISNTSATAGGAVYTLDTQQVALNDTEVSESGASTGGAAHVEKADTVSIDGGRYAENIAEDGAAVFVDGLDKDTEATIHDVRFANNTAVGAGGALHMLGGTLAVDTSVFDLTTADKGGAIWVTDNVTTVFGSAFCGANAYTAGGAIYGTAAEIDVTNSLFAGTTSPSGSILSSTEPAAFAHITALNLIQSPFVGPVSVSFSVMGNGPWTVTSLPSVTFTDVISDAPPTSPMAGALDLVPILPFLAPVQYLPGALPCGVEFRVNPVAIGVEPFLSNPGTPSTHWGVFGANASNMLTTTATGETFNWYADLDLDGFPLTVDCDDLNYNVNPGRVADCNGLVDVDCDGQVGDDDAAAYGIDADGDGYIAMGSGSCAPFAGSIVNPNVGYVDCADDDPAHQLPSPEVCDGIDNDCDGFVDEGLPVALFLSDDDGDGYGDDSIDAIELCDTTYATQVRVDLSLGNDCNDTDATIHPGATEICDTLDNNCDGSFDADDPLVLASEVGDFALDLDGDRFAPLGAAAKRFCLNEPVPPEWVPYDPSAFDCDDTSEVAASRFPGNLEVCDGIDNDCDEGIDNIDPLVESEGALFLWPDADSDGYASSIRAVWTCTADGYFYQMGDDCRDGDPTIHPNADELCDAIDHDCNGDPVNDAAGEPPIDVDQYWLDEDGDGYGATEMWICTPDDTDLYVRNGGDCNEQDAAIHPDATEVCNTTDDDCNGLIDDINGDPDGVESCGTVGLDPKDAQLWVAGGCACDASTRPSALGPGLLAALRRRRP
jgi:hypothetical protein